MSGINGIVAQLALGFALKQLAQFGAATDWAKVQQEFDVWLNNELPYLYVDKVIEAAADPVIKAIGVACQDKADVEGILGSLTHRNFADAETELLALVKKVAGVQLAGLLGAWADQAPGIVGAPGIVAAAAV